MELLVVVVTLILCAPPQSIGGRLAVKARDAFVMWRKNL